MPVYIEILKKSTRVSGCMPSVCLPHAVPSKNRAHFTVKHTELENVKNVRYGKGHSLSLLSHSLSLSHLLLLMLGSKLHRYVHAAIAAIGPSRPSHPTAVLVACNTVHRPTCIVYV